MKNFEFNSQKENFDDKLINEKNKFILKLEKIKIEEDFKLKQKMDFFQKIKNSEIEILKNKIDNQKKKEDNLIELIDKLQNQINILKKENDNTWKMLME